MGAAIFVFVVLMAAVEFEEVRLQAQKLSHTTKKLLERPCNIRDPEPFHLSNDSAGQMFNLGPSTFQEGKHAGFGPSVRCLCLSLSRFSFDRDHLPAGTLTSLWRSCLPLSARRVRGEGKKKKRGCPDSSLIILWRTVQAKSWTPDRVGL